MRCCRNRDRGFTLLELLVAVAVFAIMSVMAYGGLSNVIDNNRASREAMERLRQVQTAVSAMSRDLSQVFERGIIDAYGVSKPYLVTDSASDYDVEFTRSGRRNPAGLRRSSLQRIAYRIEEETLYRASWRQLDQAQGEEALESELLTGARSLEFRFMDENGDWHEQWPPLTAGGTGTAAPGLRAIETSLELVDWGGITRLYQVAL